MHTVHPVSSRGRTMRCMTTAQLSTMVTRNARVGVAYRQYMGNPLPVPYVKSFLVNLPFSPFVSLGLRPLDLGL